MSKKCLFLKVASTMILATISMFSSLSETNDYQSIDAIKQEVKILNPTGNTDEFKDHSGLLEVPSDAIQNNEERFSSFDPRGPVSLSEIGKQKQDEIRNELNELRRSNSEVSASRINELNKEIERYSELYTDELFPSLPKVSDVEQTGTRKDCYFLSAVASVVNSDPYKIVNMMKDNQDGTVTVRFYDIISYNKDKNITLKPIYCTVNKSVDDIKLSRRRLWVQILEKAFIKSGIRLENLTYMKNITFSSYVGSSLNNVMKTIPNSRDFFQIDEGFSECAIMNLTGKESKRITFSLLNKQKYYEFGKYNHESNLVYNKIRKLIDDKKPITTSFFSPRNTNLSLPGGHEYSILDYKEEGKHRYIKVRDPYNGVKKVKDNVILSLTSVAYKVNRNGEISRFKQSGVGTFWVELNDFVRACRSISYEK